MRVQMKNILCATDFSDFSNHTIPYGVALAKEFDAKLFICHVIDLSSIAIYGEFQLNPVDQQNRIRKQAAEQLDQIIGEQPVEWEPLISVGHAADEHTHVERDERLDVTMVDTLQQLLVDRVQHEVQEAREHLAEGLMDVLAGVTEVVPLDGLIARLKHGFEQPMVAAKHEFRVTISIGAAVFPDDGKNISTLFDAADKAMYRDKRATTPDP